MYIYIYISYIYIYHILYINYVLFQDMFIEFRIHSLDVFFGFSYTKVIRGQNSSIYIYIYIYIYGVSDVYTYNIYINIYYDILICVHMGPYAKKPRCRAPVTAAVDAEPKTDTETKTVADPKTDADPNCVAQAHAEHLCIIHHTITNSEHNK